MHEGSCDENAGTKVLAEEEDLGRDLKRRKLFSHDRKAGTEQRRCEHQNCTTGSACRRISGGLAYIEQLHGVEDHSPDHALQNHMQAW